MLVYLVAPSPKFIGGCWTCQLAGPQRRVSPEFLRKIIRKLTWVDRGAWVHWHPNDTVGPPWSLELLSSAHVWHRKVTAAYEDDFLFRIEAARKHPDWGWPE